VVWSGAAAGHHARDAGSSAEPGAWAGRLAFRGKQSVGARKWAIS